ncbi:hypothetical protein BOTNAR_0046g00070 [Botryotinia narcissicola]|uniref:Uncharacterized protein n=1 Tax=Botryotinia narcissicola TaxID=278944 RepID=A0A4Z1J0K6_9HELO|nr:hypothetical protein BOTNAR_0046g00070 [Botryotinia narcissicola]
MSDILYIDNDEYTVVIHFVHTYTERQPESESSQPQNELAGASQQDCPPNKRDDTESGFIFRDGKSLAAPISKRGITNLAETSGSTESMEVTFDSEYDLEAYLEDFSRLMRKGRFDAVKNLFKSCPSDLRDHPEFVLDFMDVLLKQGAYKTFIDFAAGKESVLLKQLSDCEQIPIQYLRSAFELGRQRAFGYLPDGDMKDTGADEAQLDLLTNFESLDSIQIARQTGTVCTSIFSQPTEYGICETFSRLFAPDMELEIPLKSNEEPSKKVPKSDETEFSGCFHFVFDWTHRSHGDESTDLALLDVLVTISLQLLSHSSRNNSSIMKIINQAMAHANQFAISLSLSNPENVQTSPYLKWALANQRLARELPSNPRQIPDYRYMKQSQGVIIFISNLPIYIPLDPHDLNHVHWKRQSRSTPGNLLKLGLEASRKNDDYSLIAQYLQEIFHTSEPPSEVLEELSHIQKDLQGDNIGYLQTFLTKYLFASDTPAIEDLSNEIKKFDEKIQELDFNSRKIDPLTRWCQRGIQAALHERLHMDKISTNSYLEEQKSAYQELPYDFKSLLAELGKEHGAYKLNFTDEALSKDFKKRCKGTIYRDKNFIVCDSSGYFTRIFEEPSHEEVLIEI